MTDNFKQIRELLDFRAEDDFYFLQILQRKKDAVKGQKVNGTNNNSRLIKAYYVKSLDQFDFIEKEVKILCEVFNARAGINLNRRSFQKMSLQHLKKVTDQIINGDYNKAHKAYSSVTGAFSHETNKKWVIDLDGEKENNLNFRLKMELFLEGLMPKGSKTVCRLLSKSGSHLITSPFNLKDFREEYPGIDVLKNGMTNLYIS